MIETPLPLSMAFVIYPNVIKQSLRTTENIPGNTFREGGDIVVPNSISSQRDRPAPSATLPRTPSSVISTGSRTPTSDDTFKLTSERSSSGQSLTFRLAALGLAEELGSRNQTRQLPNSCWHTSTSAPQHNPVTQTEFRGSDASTNISATDSGPAAPSCSTNIGNPLPRQNIPKDSHTVAFQQMSERQREKQREVVDLDDAPPPVSAEDHHPLHVRHQKLSHQFKFPALPRSGSGRH
ncbi:hypothetical protein EDD16DRAFT_547644 [Pisolithus croceorrhizus]|nr:hypothetical protein EDD16DRAFT_547644 [Pisolithus croceorrhizus]